jgi:hypothetical protein
MYPHGLSNEGSYHLTSRSCRLSTCDPFREGLEFGAQGSESLTRLAHFMFLLTRNRRYIERTRIDSRSPSREMNPKTFFHLSCRYRPFPKALWSDPLLDFSFELSLTVDRYRYFLSPRASRKLGVRSEDDCRLNLASDSGLLANGSTQ